MNCALNSRDASLPDVHGGQILTIKMTALLSTFALVLSGCGTAITVLRDDEVAARSLRKQKTYCQSIPRIYSGLAYDFCVLNAPPDPAGVSLPILLMDFTLSGVFDTALLPYTVYRQATDGNISFY